MDMPTTKADVQAAAAAAIAANSQVLVTDHEGSVGTQIYRVTVGSLQLNLRGPSRGANVNLADNATVTVPPHQTTLLCDMGADAIPLELLRRINAAVAGSTPH